MSFMLYESLRCGVKTADQKGYYANRNKKHNYKTLYRYDCEGNFISKFNYNYKNCIEAGLSYESIRIAMRPTWDTRRRLLSSANSIWILKEDFSEEELKRKVDAKKLDSNINSKANKRSKRVIQIDAETNEVVRKWDSINQAGKEEKTGYRLSCICRVLNGKRKVYAGCYWQYEDSN